MNEKDMPLKGVRVIELATYVAGPACARFLADWGADVIKIEKIEGGDPWRMYGANIDEVPCSPDENPLFDLANLNKKFISIDLKTDEGTNILHRLLSAADIFITNIRTDALKRINVSYEDLAVKYPKLVYGHITGFGYEGPAAKKPGFDHVSFWARSGLMLDLVPAEANVPTIAPSGFGDHGTAGVMVGGICAALYRAQKTGRGDMVSIALFGAGIFQAGSMIVPAQPKYGQRYPKLRSRPNIPTVQPYKCKDGNWLMLGILEFDKY